MWLMWQDHLEDYVIATGELLQWEGVSFAALNSEIDLKTWEGKNLKGSIKAQIS